MVSEVNRVVSHCSIMEHHGLRSKPCDNLIIILLLLVLIVNGFFIIY